MPVQPWPPRDAAHLMVDASTMARLEQELFDAGLPVEALMEKAALAVAQRLLHDQAPLLQRHGAVVLAGPGHNGGDGLVVARELWLAGVAVAIWCPFERLKPLSERHHRYARWLGVPQLAEPPDPEAPALWIDALFGTGQNRSPGALLETLLAERQRLQPGRLVAIDAPTGLCCDRGRPLGQVAATAAVTYCLGLRKQGLVQDAALSWVGRLERLELGLPPQTLAALPRSTPLGLGPADLAEAPWPLPPPAAGKYGRGRLLVVAGSDRYPGAAALALAGASASGCGSLQAQLPQPLAERLWLRFPHVVLSELEQLEGRLDALLLGPGLGPEPPTPATWRRLQDFAGLLVLDADGLNHLARRPEGAQRWLQQRQGPTWLTPHQQEFGRLFADLAERPALEAAAEAAEGSGASLLLKGARSVIAAADGRRWQLLQAASPSARAGLGDVLAGYAAGLGALGMAAGGADLPALLALAALAHADAGLELAATGAGAADPASVAGSLSRRPQPPGLLGLPGPGEPSP